MRIAITIVSGAILFVCVASYVLIAADPGKEPKQAEVPKRMALPEYDKEGKLLRPIGFEKWVVVGTSLGLDYSDDKPDPENPGMFHNVYLQPEAFDYYVSTGEFPEQTVFIVTNNPSRPAKTKGSAPRSGFVASPSSGLEISVKDSKRYPEGWAYFMFHDAPNKVAEQPRPAEKAFEQKHCFDCHAEHGAVDKVFTQYYSVLTEARQRQQAKSK